MKNLMDVLQEQHGDELTFQDGKVQWDKSLLLTLRKLGYDLKLEDFATRIYLYRGERCLGEVDYEVEEREPDFEYSDAYEVLLLDLSRFAA